MRLAILGCTGGVGSSLMRQALEGGHEVVGLARRPEAVPMAHDRLRVVKASASDVDTIADALVSCDAVACAVGSGGLLQARKPTTLYSTAATTLVTAMARAQVSRFVGVTAGGIVPSDDWPWFYRRIIHPMLHEMYVDMARMEDIVKASGVRYLFVRPARLLPGAVTGRYRVEPERTPPGGFLIRRADVAHYLLARLVADDFHGEGVGITR